MALECFRRRKHSEALSSYMVDPLAKLAGKQLKDGSFGNLYATTLAIQVTRTVLLFLPLTLSKWKGYFMLS